ncbi:MAG: hypothetical protein AAB657_01095 [Patescibacteria group bacterium]|mgnify:FL=1
MEYENLTKIIVIVGPMGSGKTSDLQSLLHKHELASGGEVALFRHTTDTREQAHKSHDGFALFGGPIHVVSSSAQLKEVAGDRYRVVGIDEGQFFDEQLHKVVYELFLNGTKIFVSALDTDFLGEPFPTTMQLMVRPEVKIYKMKAVCMVCGKNATRTLRLDINGNVCKSGAQVTVGTNPYRPVCIVCFVKAFKNLLNEPMLTRLRRPFGTLPSV